MRTKGLGISMNMLKFKVVLSVILALFLFLPAFAFAEAISDVAYDQENPHTIYLIDQGVVGTGGLWLTVWEDWRNRASTGADIYGQFINADGTFCGAEFIISNAAKNQTVPRASYRQGALPTNGKVVVVWQDQRADYLYHKTITGGLSGIDCTAPPTISGETSVGYNEIKQYSYSALNPANITGEIIMNGSTPQVGDGVSTTFAGTLTYIEVVPDTLYVTDGTQVCQDNGAGGFTGDCSAGSINYVTGAVSVTFNLPSPDGIDITARYDAYAVGVQNESIGTGNASATVFVGTLKNKNIEPNSVTVTDGTQICTDDGSGGFNVTADCLAGSIDYVRGDIQITFAVAPAVSADITATYNSQAGVRGVVLGTSDGVVFTFSGYLGHDYIMPRSVTVRAGSGLYADDGFGSFYGSAGTGTINYNRGNITISTPTAPPAGTPITVSYTYFTSFPPGKVNGTDSLSGRQSPKITFDSTGDRFWLVWKETRDILHGFTELCFANYGYISAWEFDDADFIGYVRLDGATLAEQTSVTPGNCSVTTSQSCNNDANCPLLETCMLTVGADIIRNGDTYSGVRQIAIATKPLEEVREFESFNLSGNPDVMCDSTSTPCLIVYEGTRTKLTNTVTCRDINVNGVCDLADQITDVLKTEPFDDGYTHIYATWDNYMAVGAVSSMKLDTATDSNSYYPTIGFDAISKRFLVAWEDMRNTDKDSTTSLGAPATKKIWGQLVYSGGGPYNINHMISYEDTDGDGKLDQNIATSTQTKPFISYDGVNQRFFAVWQDGRNGTLSQENLDIYGQKIDAEGSLRGYNFPIFTQPSNQYIPTVAYNELTNEFLGVWKDARNSASITCSAAGGVGTGTKPCGSDVYGDIFTLGQPSVTILNPDNTPLTPPLLNCFENPASSPACSLPIVKVGLASTQSFKIRNTGDTILKIDYIDQDIDCNGAAAPGRNIAPFTFDGLPSQLYAEGDGNTIDLTPGAELPLTMRFEPTAGGSFNKCFIIRTDGGSPTVNLSGFAVEPDIAVTPTTWDFGTVNIGNFADKTFVVRNAGLSDLNITSLNAPTTPFTIQSDNCSGTSVAPGATCNIVARFTPTTVAPLSVSFGINSNDPDTATLNVTLDGVGLGSVVIDVTPLTIDYGDVQIGQTSTKTVTIKNVGTKDGLDITAFSALSGAFGYVDTSTCLTPVLDAGDSCQVDIIFAPVSGGSTSTSVTINSVDDLLAPLAAVTVNLSGRGITTPVLSASPNPVTFLNTLTGSTASQVVTVTNTGTANLVITGLVYPTGEFSVSSSTCLGTFAPGATCTTTVVFSPTTAGFKQATLGFVSNDPVNPSTNITISGTASVVPVISVSPTAAAFGNVLIGLAPTLRLTVTNTGTAALDISSVTGPAGPFSLAGDTCTGASIAPNGTCQITLTFTPTTTTGSPFSSSIVINSNDPATAAKTVNVAGTAVAAPVLSAVPSSVTFTNVALGDILQQTITVTNTGTGNLIISSLVDPTGEFSVISSDCLGTIAPAGTCTAIIEFRPTTKGFKQSTYALLSNDPVNPTTTIAITGTAGSDPILSAPPAVVFPDVLLGGIVQQTITVRNGGQSDLIITDYNLTTTDKAFVIAEQTCIGTIIPSGECTITVAFRPTAVGFKQSSFKVNSNDPVNPNYEVALTGNSINTISLLKTDDTALIPPLLNDFQNPPGSESVSVGLFAMQTFKIKNTGDTTLSIDYIDRDIVCDGLDPYSMNNSPFEFDTFTNGLPPELTASDNVALDLAPGAFITLTARFTPQTAGHFNTCFSVETNIGSPVVHISGQSHTGIVVTPMVEDFGNLDIDTMVEPVERTFTVSNTDPFLSHVISLEDPGSNDFRIRRSSCGATLAPSATCEVVVAFKPSTIGAKSSTFAVNSDDPINPKFQVSLMGVGVGYPFLSALTAVQFPDVPFGGNAQQTLTVTNTGTTDLIISSLVSPIEPEFSIVTSTCIGTIAPSGTCTVTLGFSPTSVGLKQSSFGIDSNDPLKNRTTIQLYGNLAHSMGIVVTPMVESFGNVDIDKSVAAVEKTFVVSNTGTTALHIISLVDPANTVPEAAGFNIRSTTCGPTLAAAATCNIVVAFKPITLGPKSNTITIKTDDPINPNLKVSLSGLGVGYPFLDAPTAVQFPDVPFGSNAQQTITVTNTGTTNLIISSLTAPTSSEFSIVASTCAGTIAPLGTCTVTLGFSPTTVGLKQSSFRIASNDPLKADTTIQLYGNLAHSMGIVVTPMVEGFGNVDIDKTVAAVEKTFVVSNAGTTALHIISLGDPTSTEFSIRSTTCGPTLAAAATCNVVVAFKPTTRGAKSSTFTITTDDPVNPNLKVSLSGVGVGYPFLSVQSSINFTNTLPGATNSQTITVTNTGLSALIIESLSAPSGTDFSIVTSNCVATIAPAGTCTITVAMKSLIEGFKQSSFDIKSNDPVNGTKTVQLSGLVVGDPTISTPALVTFDPTVVSTTSTKTVTINNTGTGSLQINSVILPGAPFAISADTCTGQTLVPLAGACQITLAFSPTTTVGTPFSSSIVIHSNDTDNEPLTVNISGAALAAPVLTVTSPASSILTFSDIAIGATAQQTITVTNTGLGILNISSLVYPTGDFDVTSTNCVGTIAPAGTCTATVLFRPTSGGFKQSSFVLTSNDPVHPTTTVIITGTVQVEPGISVTPSPVAFDATMVHATTTKTVTVSNTGTGSLHISTVDAPGGMFTKTGDTCVGSTLAPLTGTCQITLAFAPTTTTGSPFSSTIVIHSDDPTNPALTVNLSGAAVAAPKVGVAPSPVNFPNTAPGQIAEMNVIVSNTGAAILNISGITNPTGEFSIMSSTCGSTVAAAGTCTIRVAFQPTSTGSKSSSFVINSDDPLNPALTVSLSGLGQNIPKIKADPDTAAFGEVKIGLAPTQVITVSNTGTANLTISTITGLAVPFTKTVDTCTGASLAPNGTCQVTLKFTPTTTTGSPFISSIVINSNDPATAAKTVTVTGTAVAAPKVGALPLPVNFPNTSPGQISEMNVIVSNAGAVSLNISGITNPTGEFSIMSSTCGATLAVAPATCTIRVAFQPTSTGAKSSSFVINSDDPLNPALTIPMVGLGQNIPKIKADPDPAAFGEVKIGLAPTQVITVSNTGTANLAISTITGPAVPFTKTVDTCTGASLAPNGTCQVTLKFTPTTTTGSPFSSSIVINSNDPDTSALPVILTGTGLAAPTISVSSPPVVYLPAPTVVFTTVLLGDFQQEIITVTNTGTAKLLIRALEYPVWPELEYKDFSIASTDCIGEFPPGAQCSAIVIFRPETAGFKTNAFTIISNDPINPNMTINFAGTADELPVLSVAPAMNFPDILLGSTEQQVIKVSNSGWSDLTIKSLTPPAADFNIVTSNCIGTLTAGSECAITLAFRPTSVGFKQATFDIVYKHRNDPLNLTERSWTKTIQLAGTVIDSMTLLNMDGTTLSPALLNDFQNPAGAGSVSLGLSGKQSFMIKNTGDTVLKIDQINQDLDCNGAPTTGRNISPFSIDMIQSELTLDDGNTIDLAPGASLTLSVTFTPTAAGSYNRCFVIKTDAGNPQINLSGTANAGIYVTPTNLKFQNVLVGVLKEMDVTVENTGNSPLNIIRIGVVYGRDYGYFDVKSTDCTEPLTLNQTCTVKVIFNPGTDADYEAAFDILSDDPINPSTTVTLSGTGTVEPKIKVDPINVIFGQVLVGRSLSKSITVTNKGTADLEISAVDAPSSPFTKTSDTCTDTVLAPRGTCQITLSLSPTAPGPVTSSSVVIHSNDPDSLDTTVVLTGEGGAAPIISVISPNVLPVVFPNTLIGNMTAQNIVLENTGGADLIISSLVYPTFQTNEFSIAETDCIGTITPGSQCTTTVVFRPTSTGFKQVSFDVLSNDPVNPTFSISISGTAKENPILSPSASSLNFSNILLGGNSQQTITVTNIGWSDLIITSLTPPTGEFSIVTSNCIRTLPRNGTCTITVAFIPTSAGFKQATLGIDSNDSVHPTTTISIAGNVIVIPSISVTPTSIAFGTKMTGSVTTASITVSNTGTGALHISAVDAPIAPFGKTADTCTGTTVAPNGSCSITVKYAPTVAGVAPAANVVIHSDDPDALDALLSVPLTGTAIAPPVLTVNPTSWAFPDILLGGTDQKTFTVTNTGGSSLSITGLVSPSGDFSIASSDCSGRTLTPSPAAGSQCTVSIGFAPTSAGSRQSSFSLVSNDPVNPTTTVVLTGYVIIAPVISTASTSISFGNVMTDGISTVSMTVRNAGTANLTITAVDDPASPFSKTADACEGATLAPAQTCQITVTFAPTTTTGSPFSSDIVIHSNDPNTPEMTVHLSGSGVSKPVINLDPASIAFGNQVVGSTSAQRTVTVTNNGGNVLNITSVTSPSSPFRVVTNTCSGASLAAGQTCAVVLTFVPTAYSTYSPYYLTFNSNDPITPVTRVTLSGTGVRKPTISTSPTSLAFGNRRINTTSAKKTVTVKNTASGTNLVIGSVDFSDPAYYTTRNTCTGATLAYNRTCVIDVVFRPTDRVTYSDGMTINSNDSARPAAQVTLSGKGI